MTRKSPDSGRNRGLCQFGQRAAPRGCQRFTGRGTGQPGGSERGAPAVRGARFPRENAGARRGPRGSARQLVGAGGRSRCAREMAGRGAEFVLWRGDICPVGGPESGFSRWNRGGANVNRLLWTRARGAGDACRRDRGRGAEAFARERTESTRSNSRCARADRQPSRTLEALLRVELKRSKRFPVPALARPD
jgi:hypothetical protein